MPKVRSACKFCTYFDEPTSQCRRFAPTGSTIAATRLEQNKPWLAVWPIVRPDEDWCGEWEV